MNISSCPAPRILSSLLPYTILALWSVKSNPLHRIAKSSNPFSFKLSNHVSGSSESVMNAASSNSNPTSRWLTSRICDNWFGSLPKTMNKSSKTKARPSPSMRIFFISARHLQLRSSVKSYKTAC